MDFVIFTCVSGLLFQRSIGAYQLAFFLRQNGYRVQVIDFTDHFTYEELLKISLKFVNDETLAIGISTTFYSDTKINWGYSSSLSEKFNLTSLPDNIRLVLNYLKQNFKRLKFILGGSKATSTKLEIVDKIINGYAEQDTFEYLESLKGKSIIKNFKKPTSIFSIEHLQHRYSPQDCITNNETIPIEISRGCIFKCKFCAFPLNGKTKLDYIRNPLYIKEEMLYNFEKYNITNYFFSDDTFNDSTEKIEKIHNVITTLPFKIKFTTYLRLDLLYHNKEQIKLLKEMGLATAFFGIESLNQKTASSIGKGMNVNKTKDFLYALQEDWDNSIPITCSFIIGLPHESIDSICKTFEWIKNSPFSSMFFPLALTDKAYYKSEFDLNYETYGYKFYPETGKWKNNFMDFDKALEMSNKFNDELMKKNDTPSGWFLMSLLNNGYDFHEAKSLKIKDLNTKRILRAKLNKVNEYKKLLLGN